MEALVKIGVDEDMTPQGLVNFLTTELPSTSNLISLSDKDLPPEGDQHNKALHLTVVCRQMNVPMSLVDNGSAINVCPLRTAKKLGIKNEELTPSTQGIRAYDNTRRQAVGTIILNITTGAVERRTKFQVVDIKASFNPLLGRPWLHELKAIPSSLHQKVKAIVGGIPITIDASPMRIQVIDTPIVHVEHDEEDEDLWGFSLDDVLAIEEEEKCHLDFDPYSNTSINAILKKQGHFPGMTLGLKKEMAKSWGHPGAIKKDTFGLGFEPTKEDLKQAALKMKARNNARITKTEMAMDPYPFTLNGQYIKEGEDFP